MNAQVKKTLLSAIGVWIVLLAAACQDSPSPVSGGEPTQRSRSQPNASVTGTVTYRERLALSPGATLKVQLRDVSLQDAASTLIAEQIIPNPGQVPIKFKVQYNRQDIASRNTYSIQARIIESDGRLAFINDTAYEVITRGNPRKVDIVLVMVEPPPVTPDPSGNSDSTGASPTKWVEALVPVVGAKVIESDSEYLLLVTYLQSSIDGCSRPGGQESELNGSDIIVRVTLMEPPPTPWAIPCHEAVLNVETIVPIGASFTPDQIYRVKVNDLETTAFTLLEPDFPDSYIALSPIESVEVVTLDSAPPQYELRVISGLPKGSGCSRFSGYEIRRTEPRRIDVDVTHHEVADPFTICTADYPTLRTSIPLGADFDPGLEYTVSVNSDTTHTFLAR